METGAPTAAEVSHAITLKGAQLTFAILHQHKTIENRHIRMRPGWYAVHTGMGKLSKDRGAELAALIPGLPQEKTLPHGFITGAMRIDRHVEVADCADTPSASWALGPVCNVVGAVALLPEPLPHKGALGVWPMDTHVRQTVREALLTAEILENDPAR